MKMECLADKTENRFEIKKKKILENHSSLKGKRKAEIKSLRLLDFNSRTPKLVNSIKIFDSYLMPDVINSYRDY